VFKEAICVHNSYSKTEDNNVHNVVMSFTKLDNITLYYTCALGVSILVIILYTVKSHHTENDYAYFYIGYLLKNGIKTLVLFINAVNLIMLALQFLEFICLINSLSSLLYTFY
jgi:hypothetical protein